MGLFFGLLGLLGTGLGLGLGLGVWFVEDFAGCWHRHGERVRNRVVSLELSLLSLN